MRSTRTSRRRALLLGAGAAAAVLGLASTAFACTFYKGNVTVSDTVDGVTTTAWADGNPGTAHSFCLNGVTHQNQLAQPVDLSGNFTVTAGVTTNCPAPQNKADAKGYTINWATPIATGVVDSAPKGEVYVPGHCNTNDNTLQELAAVTVGSTGAFSSSPVVQVPAGVQPGPAAICFLATTDPSNVLPEVRLQVL